MPRADAGIADQMRQCGQPIAKDGLRQSCHPGTCCRHAVTTTGPRTMFSRHKKRTRPLSWPTSRTPPTPFAAQQVTNPSPGHDASRSPLVKSHTLSAPYDAAKASRPSGVTATATLPNTATPPKGWPTRVRSSFPLARSHTWSVDCAPEMAMRPSGVSAKAVTIPPCLPVRSSCPVATSHTLSVSSRDARESQPYVRCERNGGNCVCVAGQCA